MIANFFNKSKPVIDFIITIMLLGYFLTATFLFKFEGFSLVFIAKKIGLFFSFILVMLITKFIISKNNLTQDNSYALLLMIFLMGTFYETMFTYNIVFANIILLFAFRKIYSLKSEINTKLKLFDAGFWLGIAALIYPLSILYLVLVYIAIVIYQKINFKNLCVPLIGFAIPIFIYFTYCFYFDDLPLFYSHLLLPISFNETSYYQLKLVLPITFLLILILVAIIVLAPKVGITGINSKRYWRLTLNYLIISALIILISPNKNGSEMFFMLFPFTVIIANFIQVLQSEKIKNLILYLFVFISIVVYVL